MLISLSYRIHILSLIPVQQKEQHAFTIPIKNWMRKQKGIHIYIYISTVSDFCDTFPPIGSDTLHGLWVFIDVFTFVLKDLIDVRLYWRSLERTRTRLNVSQSPVIQSVFVAFFFMKFLASFMFYNHKFHVLHSLVSSNWIAQKLLPSRTQNVIEVSIFFYFISFLTFIHYLNTFAIICWQRAQSHFAIVTNEVQRVE